MVNTATQGKNTFKTRVESGKKKDGTNWYGLRIKADVYVNGVLKKFRGMVFEENNGDISDDEAVQYS